VKSILWTFCAALLVCGVAAAVDVRLNDGTVIEAESYRLTGSYIMLKLADGRQVAYDVADVDLEALRAAEAAAAAESGAQQETEPDESSDTLASGRSLKDASTAGEDQGTALTISDRDVRHVRGSQVQGEEEEDEAANPTEVTEDHQQGGAVMINGLRIDKIGEGRWQITGEVLNRSPEPVLDVYVKLETMPSDGAEPWNGEVPVSGSLGADETAPFSHTFSAPQPSGSPAPNVRASVFWMRKVTTRVADYTGAGGVPHPSNLPLQRGGVTGAQVRPTPIQ
jgi:hypothetical protein